MPFARLTLTAVDDACAYFPTFARLSQTQVIRGDFERLGQSLFCCDVRRTGTGARTSSCSSATPRPCAADDSGMDSSCDRTELVE